MKASVSALALSIAVLLGSCSSDSQVGVAQNIFADLGAPLPSATAAELRSFERGRAAALRRFTPSDGLGPEFNLTFCAGCHEKPVFGGGASHYRDFLLVGDELYPDTVVPRGKNGVQRQFSLETGRAPSDPLTNISATRNPIPFFGTGLLAEIPDTEIVSHADPDDSDGDGISGRVNYDGVLVGRFGRKAQTSRLELFVRGPLFNHLGITSEPLSEARRAELRSFSASAGVVTAIPKQAVIPDEPTVDLDDVPDPELSEDELFDLVAFASLLAAPRPDESTDETERGAITFSEVGCDRCHLPSLSGPRGSIPAYTDLLLHDMGDELADRFPMGQATGREFRTQPLWGIAAASPYLHDGRAATLDEAIQWHGGEATEIRDAYAALPAGGRADLIAFLESLGGRAQSSPGLRPPDAPVPSQGEYGAPVVGLSAEEQALFEQGRLLFDRDFSFSEGVGPSFNGDACRSCHFDPVIGGAGPSGVDAMRQGRVEAFIFSAPDGGTAIPRHAVNGVRPEADPSSNFFERRQTPSTLGLGLLEQVPRETIEALADPSDENDDLISGRVHILDDGRMGRFGWKANVPSVREFVRDAFSGELGVTVPEEPGFTFGLAADDDGVADPEVDVSSIDAITAFIQFLDAPPRDRSDETLEDRGEAIFDVVGCAQCHVPNLETRDGTELHAYTDLLLHEIAKASDLGIEEGDAGIHEFRTPPLWGLSRTAPYLHDGRASTIEDAIAEHSGEALTVRGAFEALSPADQDALLAFLRSL